MFQWKVILPILIVVIIASVVFRKKNNESVGNQEPKEFTDQEYDRYYELKEAALEQMLGKMHDMVGHAMIPFAIGGNVDMYYFPNALPGTGFATMELIEPGGNGPKPNRIGTYELVTFTKHPFPPKGTSFQADIPFNEISGRMCGVMTTIGFYSYETVINPGETSEIPMEDEPNICLIFDEYKNNGKGFEIDGKRHCLLLCIEVFRSEMEYARNHEAVLNALKAKGYYPYSDLDREPVF